MTDPTRNPTPDPIFRDMAEQMTPDADLRRRLDERLAAEPAGPQVGTGPPISTVPTTAPPLPRWSRPSTWLAAAAAVVLVAGIGGGVVVALRDDSAPRTSAADYRALYEAVSRATTATDTGAMMNKDGITAPDAAEAAPQQDQAQGTSSAADDYTTTNVQVAGIDEADVVKTDGQVLYAATDQHVTVVGLAGPDTRTLAQIDLEPTEQVLDLLLYRDGGRGTLVVIADEYSGATTYPYFDGRSVGPTPPQTVVRLYDVTDPATPTLRTTARQSGSYRTARLLQGVVYLVSDYSLWSQQIDPKDPATFVPLVGGPDGTELLVPDEVTMLPSPSARYAVATAFDLRSGERTGQQAVLGGADTVYMSAANLYLGGTSYPQVIPQPGIAEDAPVAPLDWEGPQDGEGPTTSLVRLSLTDGPLTVAAQGSVPGSLLSQFSLDEYDGRLRVVTTTQKGWTDSAGLYVLGPDLRQTGSVTDLAPDEQVKSVRFAGTVGYVVTFRQTDPLFAIDLSDPAHPTVTSELKIPGFSTYLHPWGADRLVGLGYAGTGTGLTGGLKLSLFDISDPYAVTEAQSLLVTGDWSEALSDHRAVFVDPERGLIGFPVSSWDRDGDVLRYLVYEVDATRGFTLQHDLVVKPVGNATWPSAVRATRAGDHLYVSWNGGLDVYQTVTGTLVAQVDLR